MPSGYRRKKIDKKLKSFEKVARSFEKRLADVHGAAAVRGLTDEALEEFRAVLPEAPKYGGGPLNPFNTIAAAGAQMVAIYRPMRERQMPVEQAALLFYDHYYDLHHKMPRPARWVARKFIFSRVFLKMMQYFTDRMTARKDPDGFDIRYVGGDGIECDWYFSAKNCGMVNFLRKQGCGELTPYCNMIDYIQGEMLGMGVRFASCLGTGDEICEEYMKQGRETEIPTLVADMLERRDEIMQGKSSS